MRHLVKLKRLITPILIVASAIAVGTLLALVLIKAAEC